MVQKDLTIRVKAVHFHLKKSGKKRRMRNKFIWKDLRNQHQLQRTQLGRINFSDKNILPVLATKRLAAKPAE